MTVPNFYIFLTTTAFLKIQSLGGGEIMSVQDEPSPNPTSKCRAASEQVTDRLCDVI